MVVTGIVMLEAFLKALDKVIDLAKRGEQQHADLFKNFVEPAWKDFEAVHQNYLDSLRRYSDLLSDGSTPIDHNHPIFGAIERDSLYSESIRAKVVEARSLANDQHLGPLISCMAEYLVTVPRTFKFLLTGDEPRTKPTSWDLARCLPRTSLKEQLRFVASKNVATEDQRRMALLCVADAIQGLQGAFVRALITYNDTKLTLLTPKKVL